MGFLAKHKTIEQLFNKWGISNSIRENYKKKSSAQHYQISLMFLDGIITPEQFRKYLSQDTPISIFQFMTREEYTNEPA